MELVKINVLNVQALIIVYQSVVAIAIVKIIFMMQAFIHVLLVIIHGFIKFN